MVCPWVLPRVWFWFLLSLVVLVAFECVNSELLVLYCHDFVACCLFCSVCFLFLFGC